MRILAFDTCLGACSVAVVDLDGAIRNVIASRCELMATGHAERLLPMIQETMAAAACTFPQLDAIAVPRGPGTFTGVRTGIACARGLALASSLPVYTLSSLALLARTAATLLDGTENHVLRAACVDARNGQLYVQFFQASSGVALTEPRLLQTVTAAQLFGDQTVLAVGTGAQSFAASRRALGFEADVAHPHLQPDAACVHGADIDRAEPPHPLYLREPDAKPPSDTSLARAAT